jgi:hypothetical protein
LVLTRSTISLSRRAFALEGLLRPLTCVLPSLLLLPFWRRMNMIPASPLGITLWIFTTVAIAWFAGLTSEERQQLRVTASRLLHCGPSPSTT